MKHSIDVNARIYFDDVNTDDVLKFLKKIEKAIDNNLIKQKEKKIRLVFTDNMIPLRIEVNRILDTPSKRIRRNGKNEK